MLSRYLDIVEKAVERRVDELDGLNGRIAILAVFMFTVSIYTSGFNPIISTLISIFILVFSRSSIYGIIASIPFLILFSVSILFFGGDLKIVLAIIALITIGSGILYGVDVEELRSALVYFKIPKKIVFTLFLAFRMFQIYVRDLKNISEVLSLSETGLSYYTKLMKTFISVIVLRSIAISETLYSRNLQFDFYVDYKDCKFKKRDYILLAFSTFVLTLAISLRFLNSIRFIDFY
ncbi:hypothetical protein DRP05_11555 [Archaeoglobales archaeon]|nr:MAG: hypothetical protein DRP05_11555 [Archaeoglobales archaeon]